MANAAVFYALATALAVAHVGGCSPAPATEVANSPTPQQTDAAAPASPAPAPQEPTAAPAAADSVETPIPATTSAAALTVSPDGSKMSFADESLKFTVTLPPGGATDPVLAEARAEAKRYFDAMKIDARQTYNAIIKDGEKAPTWDISVTWRHTAEADGIVSLHGVQSEWIGQIHPNWQIDTIIARKSGEHLKFDDMLILQRSPSPAMIVALCEALKAEKIRKTGRAEIADEPISCVGANANVSTEKLKIALAPSNKPDKFGGIYIYFDPYAVGSYAEGSYELTIQQEIFAEDLKPEFKSLFGGEAPVLKTPF